MQTISRHLEDPLSIPLGQRRGISNLARINLDSIWTKEQEEPGTAAARSRAYPSPPMSGSPSLPPNTSQEAGSRAHPYSSYPTANPQDAYRRNAPAAASAPHGSFQEPPPTVLPPQPRRYHPEPAGGMAYAYPPPDDPAPTSTQYPHATTGHVQSSHHHQASYASSIAGPAAGPAPLPPSQQTYVGQAPQSSEETQPYASPKSQRKTKGHVASACVPCKKAHLRCLSNGKEDACVDVQHKKRGRPRLRDDREGRFGPANYAPSQDAAMRRPLSLYSPGGPVSGYGDPVRHSQSYRVLKSQQSEHIAPRYIERASPSDANVYGAPIPIQSAPLEPVAFLNLNLEVVKASPTFIDAVGVANIRGRVLTEITAPTEVARIQSHQLAMQEERSKRDPMYLPPIFGKEQEERVFDTLRFDADEVARLPMDRHDILVFVGADGQRRSLAVRMGTEKRDSIYFIALALNTRPGFPYALPSPGAREGVYTFPPQGAVQNQQAPPHQQFAPQHPAPTPAAFDGRQRFGEAPVSQRPGVGPPPPPPSASASNFSPGLSPGFSPGVGPGMPSYAASPSRPEYAAGPSTSYIPRSELQPAPRPPLQQQQQPSYQLPPIRFPPQQEPTQTEQSPKRLERGGRVDIGGLIEKPEERRPPQ